MYVILAYDIGGKRIRNVMKTVKKLSKHMEEVLGSRTIWKVIGSDVPHAHVHLLPFDSTWYQNRRIDFTEDDFKAMQQKLSLA